MYLIDRKKSHSNKGLTSTTASGIFIELDTHYSYLGILYDKHYLKLTGITYQLRYQNILYLSIQHGSVYKTPK